MATNNITLSAGVRQNLLSLQNTAQLMSQTQNRLATGKKVNSALDNPANFFTSQSLSNRASDLNSLLDSIGQAQQTLNAADQGLTSLTKLVESAKSIAKQARQAAQPTSNTFGTITVNGTAQAESLSTTGNGTSFSGSSIANNTTYTFSIDINGAGPTAVSYVSDASATGAEVLAGLQASFASAATAAGLTAGTDIELVANAAGDGIKINALKADADFEITSAGNTGLTAATYNSTSLLDNIVAAGGTAGTSTLTVAVNGGQTQTVTFGTGAGEVSTDAELTAALSNVSGLTASVSGTSTSFVVGSSSVQNNLTLTASAGVTTALGISGSYNQNGALVSTTGTDSSRSSLQADFNDIISQIDALSKDTSYNGINLLAGDNLKVVFNEKGTSSLTISGVNYDSAGLGLSTVSGNGFQSVATIDSTISDLDTALSTLRTQASKFGSNLTTVQTRQDFTKNLISTLQSGADNLVLADTNEEGANLLALQTRQQLSTTALSLSAQADQAVLRLF
jgi:flagellin-like hook-associated protein FlgL